MRSGAQEVVVQAGIIEGFFGEPWTWAARADAAEFLGARGGAFYLYAPKADRRLRKEWAQPHDRGDAKSLRDLGATCRRHGVRFGVGLTPYGLHERWGPEGRAELSARLESLKRLRLDWIAILFDDMPGNFPNLARTQAEIVQHAADAGVADSIAMCPTYYTDQDVLDRLFGPRPKDYLRDLGRALDEQVEICWTGPKVLSVEYTASHLRRVTGELGREPFIWDNYPVNDGPRMSKFIHLRAPNRPASLRRLVSGLAINPMNQSALSKIPLDAALRSFTGAAALGDLDAETDAAIDRVVPADLAVLLKRDWRSFQHEGLDPYSRAEKAELLGEYAAIDHPAAAEVGRWLRGEYVVSADILTDV
ncbi:MAG: hyaluronoglucosaminidase [Myxococcota bacterium]|jgi:hyaluronoglucosaminidase